MASVETMAIVGHDFEWTVTVLGMVSFVQAHYLSWVGGEYWWRQSALAKAGLSLILLFFQKKKATLICMQHVSQTIPIQPS